MLTNSLLFSHILEELPYVFVQAVTYGVIVYAMPGFDWTVEKFFWYLFFMYFTLLYFTFYGMMAVGVKPNHHVVSIVAAVFYAIWNLFSGFIVVRPHPLLVEMVLLGMSSGLDLIWIGCISVWRHNTNKVD
ncbi:hypothetical protein JHK82_038272 [Glycine max]|nr:hypothetical protein JHK86_038459 [Glycine max]KAG5115003.1 hypothetical protein JHK82_038272 [Glycine max]KAG5132281.1 hypothetical protein JHK84_038678 [Glycine max]